ncbi:MAG TPA: DUF2846 domain-containing protein, partial [Opitutales bacterium]|nr:DUF2846 domain-containing protein [Opitutales bacterium]
LISLLCGCASVPLAPTEQDTQAKEFKTADNKAALYIYRDESFGGGVPMAIAVNGRSLGQTAPDTYFYLELEPGKYVIDSYAENLSELTVNLIAGQTCYVWQEVKLGLWAPQSALNVVDEAKGKAGVKECKLIAAPVFGEDIAPLKP